MICCYKLKYTDESYDEKEAVGFITLGIRAEYSDVIDELENFYGKHNIEKIYCLVPFGRNTNVYDFSTQPVKKEDIEEFVNHVNKMYELFNTTTKGENE